MRVNRSEDCDDEGPSYLGLVPLTFKIPGMPEKMIYEQEESEEYDYPPLILMYGSDGLLKPLLVPFGDFKTSKQLRQVMPFQSRPAQVEDKKQG
jgi:hypothetical protein